MYDKYNIPVRLPSYVSFGFSKISHRPLSTPSSINKSIKYSLIFIVGRLITIKNPKPCKQFLVFYTKFLYLLKI